MRNKSKKYFFYLRFFLIATLCLVLLYVSQHLLINASFSQLAKGNYKVAGVIASVNKVVLAAFPNSKSSKDFLEKNLQAQMEVAQAFLLADVSINSLERGHKIDKSTLAKIENHLYRAYLALGFASSHINALSNFQKFFLGTYSKEETLESFRSKFYKLSRFSSAFPELLGYEGQKKYLVLFEDSEYLMPGGAKISKAYLLTLKEGTVVDTREISLDEKSQMPLQIEKFDAHFSLEEASMGVSNINPDFPLSSENVLFLAGALLNEKADGLISLNLSSEEIREYTEKKQKTFTFAKILDLLGQKRLRLFSTEEHIYSFLNDIDITGEIKPLECFSKCYRDIFGLNETSKNSQKDILREAHLSVFFEEGVIKSQAVIVIENTGENAYKGYFQIIAPEHVGFSQVHEYSKKSSRVLKPQVSGYDGFKSAGIFTEILPKDSTALVFSWEGGPYSQEDLKEYTLKLISQSGAGKNKISIRFKSSSELFIPQGGGFGLTQSGELRYNSNLVNDKDIRIFVK